MDNAIEEKKPTVASFDSMELPVPKMDSDDDKTGVAFVKKEEEVDVKVKIEDSEEDEADQNVLNMQRRQSTRLLRSQNIGVGAAPEDNGVEKATDNNGMEKATENDGVEKATENNGVKKATENKGKEKATEDRESEAEEPSMDYVLWGPNAPARAMPRRPPRARGRGPAGGRAATRARRAGQSSARRNNNGAGNGQGDSQVRGAGEDEFQRVLVPVAQAQAMGAVITQGVGDPAVPNAAPANEPAVYDVIGVMRGDAPPEHGEWAWASPPLKDLLQHEFHEVAYRPVFKYFKREVGKLVNEAHAMSFNAEKRMYANEEQAVAYDKLKNVLRGLKIAEATLESIVFPDEVPGYVAPGPGDHMFHGHQLGRLG
ncbi:hypothetical protein F4779DRAFT_618682 [Xylariaceae sp. FL0662B]|nr:hypothetical protein F4779DRAFT_618682 [Xylariaceae sp. FL0662B]